MELVVRMAERQEVRWPLLVRVAEWLKPGPRVVSEADLPERIRRDIGLG